MKTNLKRNLVFILCIFLNVISFAQTKTPSSKDESKTGVIIETETDTAKILNGKITIISKKKNGESKANTLILNSRGDSTRKKVTTDWGGFEIGFINYFDRTDYTNPGPLNSDDQGFLAQMNPTANMRDFELRSGKSIQLNFSIFKQRLSLYKHHVNLVYGLTYEIRNWRYKLATKWNPAPESPLPQPGLYQGPFVTRDTNSLKKNKLVTNYIQVPLSLRFETNPLHTEKNVWFGAGGYAGYLVRSHTKQVIRNSSSKQQVDNGSTTKEKQFEEFNLNKFQYGLQFELGYRQLAVYFKSDLSTLTEYGTQQYPYCFGLRLAGL